MKAIGHVIKAVTALLAVYLIALWAYQGVGTLIAPVYGLGDFLKSQTVYSVGRVLELSPLGLMRTAAFLATVKLAVAALLVWHLVERVRAFLNDRRPDYWVLEAGLILAGLVIVAMSAAPLAENNNGLVQTHAHLLLLVGTMAGLVCVERLAGLDRPAPDELQILAQGPATQAAAGFDPGKVVPLADNIAPWLRRFTAPDRT